MSHGERLNMVISGRQDRTQVRWMAAAPLRSVLALPPIALVACGLLGFSAPAEAAGGPGSMKVTPTAVAAGTNPSSLKFTYVAPTDVTSGTLLLTIPTGWTAPQKSETGSPGHVAIGTKTCNSAVLSSVSGSGPWVIKVKVDCAAGKKFKISYGNVSVPTTAATDQFPASFKSGKNTTPLTSSAQVSVSPGPASSLVLSGPASVAPELQSPTAQYSGQFTATYTAEAFDQFGNDIGDVTSSTGFNISPDGECDLAQCVVRSVGPHEVTGTFGSASGEASLDGDPTLLQMACLGANYDVNGDVTDGCEQLQSDAATTQSNATSLGSISCNDGNGDTVSYTGSLLSDTRVHEFPSILGFNPEVGSAPSWRSIDAIGGTFCEDDVVLTLSVTGSEHPAGCYQLTAITNKETYSATTDSTGTASINETNGQYSDGTTIYLEVQKVCSTTVTEAVTYSVNGHI
jgi:hypothetical protein